jgi:hypothetical protein
MQPAKDTIPGSRVRILHELKWQSGSGKIFFVPGFDEKTAFVANEINADDEKPSNGVRLT